MNKQIYDLLDEQDVVYIPTPKRVYECLDPVSSDKF